MSNWWLREMRCPTCASRLSAEGDDLQCGCGLRFPVVRGVPVMIDPERSLFDPGIIMAETQTKTERRGFRRYVPSLSLNPRAAHHYGQFTERLVAQEGPARVLIVGAGEGGEGAEALTSSRLDVLNSDVAIGPRTHVVLDSHHIPFASNTFDGVVMQAVLEHVADPERCVEEAMRVLKPGGLVYAETPFMQQVHMAGFDFSRFTPVGHRRLFRQFEELDSGVAVGPGSALAWSLTYFANSFPKTKQGRRVVNILARFMFFWLKHFDRFLNSRPGALDAAAGVYFLGRLSASPVPDKAIVSAYRGAMR